MRSSERKQLRCENHDYSSECIYYVTICTDRRLYLFGDKKDGKIELSSVGLTVKNAWEKIGEKYSGIYLDEYVIMPNHIHGIVIFSLQQGERKKTLSDIIRDFKSYTAHEYFTIKTRMTRNLWQRGFFERVIRYNEMDKCREYIMKNPGNWENDPFYVLEKEYLRSLHSM